MEILKAIFLTIVLLNLVSKGLSFYCNVIFTAAKQIAAVAKRFL